MFTELFRLSSVLISFMGVIGVSSNFTEKGLTFYFKSSVFHNLNKKVIKLLRLICGWTIWYSFDPRLVLDFHQKNLDGRMVLFHTQLKEICVSISNQIWTRESAKKKFVKTAFWNMFSDWKQRHASRSNGNHWR